MRIFPTVPNASMPMRERGAKTRAIGCEIGVGELLGLALASAKAHALWERRVSGEGGLNSNLTTVNDLPLGPGPRVNPIEALRGNVFSNKVAL